MILYSKELKKAVMGYVKDERQMGDLVHYPIKAKDFIPLEVALPKKDFPNDHKNYKTDWVDEDDFLVEFEDINKIVGE